MDLRVLPITSIRVTSSSRREFGDIDGLAASIKDVGLLQPIVVNSNHQLVCGERRLLACQRLGRKAIDAHVAHDLDDALKALQAQRAENVHRKDFTPSEAVAIGKRIEEAYRPKAEKAMAEGQKAGGNTGGRRRQNSSGANCPRAIRDESKRTTAVAAEAAGMSRKTYEKAKKVVDAAVQQPDLFGPVVAEMDATGKVDPAYRKVQETKLDAEVKAQQERRASRKGLTPAKWQAIVEKIEKLNELLSKPALCISVLEVQIGVKKLLEEVRSIQV